MPLKGTVEISEDAYNELVMLAQTVLDEIDHTGECSDEDPHPDFCFHCQAQAVLNLLDKEG